MTKLDLNERKQRLLMTLVERHIRDGQPVGSKTLASGSGLTVSPATVRTNCLLFISVAADAQPNLELCD